MRKYSFFQSFLTAIVLAAILFFLLYFFFPSVSEQAFGFSWQSSRDARHIKEVVVDILEEARVPRDAIQEYVKQFDAPEFQKNLVEASRKGKDHVVSYLSSLGDGIDFGSIDTRQLEQTFHKGFANIKQFSSRQIRSLERLFTDVLGNF